MLLPPDPSQNCDGTAFHAPTNRYVPAPADTPNRLGVRLADTGIDIAVLATRADAVEICLFDSYEPQATEERWRLHGPREGVWHGHIPGIEVGQAYGFRVYGPWDPSQGLLYNPAKLLLDPYARSLVGEVELCPATHGHQVDPDFYPTVYPLERNLQDSAPHTVKGVVTAKGFKLAPKPQTPWNETVIYEAHVKGITKLMPGIPEDLRGTYAGLAHPTMVEYFKNLGITAVELLPIYAKMDEPFLTERGLSNYWGYSPLSFFAPEPSYATKRAQEAGPLEVLAELRGMVSILHEAGIEVLLDVVYNHTCENGSTGQTISWKGFGSNTYYLHNPDDHNHLIDVTGTGNSLDFSNSRVIQMTLDSLRYWTEEIGIDGFRFDLAVTLARQGNSFTPDHPFLVALAQDPVLYDSKMIAEPWDIGTDGWQTGNFPRPFSEWNDRFRDSARRFWLTDAQIQSKGDQRVSGPNDLATRLSGSQDVFNRGKFGFMREPRSSINFVTAHDGFTLFDLVSYNYKHNLDNLEDNRDGTPNNNSWNHGAEGGGYLELSDSAEESEKLGIFEDILPMRQRSMLNLFATIAVSAGTPMFVAGDEFARTQLGNNNAYCQDNEISWLNWNLTPWQLELREMVRYLLKLRSEHPVMRPKHYLTSVINPGDTIPELSWYDRRGSPVANEAWHSAETRALQMLRSGLALDDVDLLVLFNGTLNPIPTRLAPGRGLPYELVWDSSWNTPEDGGFLNGPQISEQAEIHNSGEKIHLEPLSIRIYFSRNQGLG